MTATALVLLMVAATAAALDWWAVAVRNRQVEYVAKPLVMLALITAAIAIGGAATTIRIWFVIALVLSLIGDVLLMLERERFLGGLVAFLLAHLAYIAGFAAAGIGLAPLAVGAAVVSIAVATVGRRIGAATAARHPALTTPVWAYIAVISLMLATAIGTAQPVAVTGAASFYISDALLGWNRFVSPTPYGRLAVIVPYHIGQGLLVAALAAL